MKSFWGYHIYCMVIKIAVDLMQLLPKLHYAKLNIPIAGAKTSTSFADMNLLAEMKTIRIAPLLEFCIYPVDCYVFGFTLT